MKRIPIGAAERIAKAYGYDQVIIYARKVGADPDDPADPDLPGGEHVTTYGVSKAHCGAAAKIGRALHCLLGWPLPVDNVNSKG